MKNWWIVQLVVIIVFFLAAGCTSTNPPPRVPDGVTVSPSDTLSVTTVTSATGPFTLHVADLTPGSLLPDTYTCKGTSESPAVSWENVPAGTKSLVLLVVDQDAQNGAFTHWIVYNIPRKPMSLTGGQPNLKVPL